MPHKGALLNLLNDSISEYMIVYFLFIIYIYIIINKLKQSPIFSTKYKTFFGNQENRLALNQLQRVCLSCITVLAVNRWIQHVATTN